MSTDKTDPQGKDPTTSPISNVESRLVRPKEAKSAALEPRMVQAHRTLAALVASATAMPVRLKAEFKLVGIGVLRTTSLDKFYLADHNDDAHASFTLSFEYRGREELKHVCGSEHVYNSLRKSLFAHGLVFKSAASATANRLTIEAVVPAAVTIACDASRERASITLRNVVMLGSTEYHLPVDSLDRALIDALVELITNQDKTFYTLTASLR